MKAYWKNHPALRMILMLVLFVLALVLVVSGWKMTGQLAGLGIMLVGVALLLAVLALYNDVRRNITTNINTAMMVYLAQQASGMHFSGDIVNVPGTSVMGAQRHAEYQVDPDALLEMVLDIFYEPVDG